MKRLAFLSIFLGSLFTSCARDEIKIDPDNLLIGVWIHSDFHDNADIYTRNQEFTDNHCYKFNSDGTIIERKNSGWCGTPPISYSDFEGSWSVLNDTLIQIKVGYWGGTMSYNFDIESVSTNSLILVYIPIDE
jgi:hypothetical protein